MAVFITVFETGYYSHHYAIVRDMASGRTNAYTVYQLPARGSGRVKVVGRELTLRYAKSYVKKLVKEDEARAKKLDERDERRATRNERCTCAMCYVKPALKKKRYS